MGKKRSISDNYVLSAEESSHLFGGAIARQPLTLSDAAEKLNAMMAGIEDLSAVRAALNPSIVYTYDQLGGTSIPARVLAQMRLSEYYLLTEGDLFQTVAIPVDLGVQDLGVRGSDKGAVTEIENLFTALDVEQIAHDLWYCMESYGQAYPMEVWDGKVPVNLSTLNPKYIVVNRRATFDTPSYSLSVGGRNLREEFEKGQIPLQVQECFVDPKGAIDNVTIEFRPGVVTQVRSRGASFDPYVTPPLTRSFRNLSTRQVLEELIRATMEGYKNQLWLFTLENPKPNELKTLQSVLNGMNGERTGMLVWRKGLIVEQFAPKPLDSMLANEKWMSLTQQIMRDRGVSLRLLGDMKEVRGSASSDVDIKVFIARLNFNRGQILKYLRTLIAKYARANGMKAPPEPYFEKVALELEDLIKGQLMPLYRSGALSAHTLLEQAGHSYENELMQKQEEAPDRTLFMPVPTFSQTTVNPHSAEKTSTFDPYSGRPSTATGPRSHETQGAAPAGWEGWAATVTASFQAYLASGDASSFIAEMRRLNGQHMGDAYQAGYQKAGGSGEVNSERAAAIVAWNDSFLDRFEDDLVGRDPASREGARSRALMYPREGYLMAFVYGAFQARREQGYTHWRRVIRPEASQAGPCPKCLADSRVQHPIGEEFFEFHPHGVCGQSFLVFDRGDVSSMPFVLPHQGLPQERGRILTPRVENV